MSQGVKMSWDTKMSWDSKMSWDADYLPTSKAYLLSGWLESRGFMKFQVVALNHCDKMIKKNIFN